MGARGEAGRVTLPASLGVFLSLAAVTTGLTVLFLGMRAVMEIGGACAEGGPFIPIRPCPTGVPLLMTAGILGGLVASGLYVWQSLKHGVPSLAGLLWPALFLSLGWNFFEFGLDGPGDAGVVWGWIVCGVVFALMGGLPLLGVLPATVRRFAREASARSGPSGTPAAIRSAFGAMRPGGHEVPGDDAASPFPPSMGDDLVLRLERLSALRVSGALSEEEYAEAKRRLLGLDEP